MRALTSTVVCFLTLLAPPARAQITVEARGGFSVGSHTATAASLELVPMFSYDALLLRRLTRTLSLVAGYAHTAFGCEGGFCNDRSLTVTGRHGLVGVERSSGGPWLRLAALVGTTRVGTEGEAPDLGIGVYAAAGLTLGGGRVRGVPGISYRWMKANTPSSADHAAALAFDLGISVRLGSGGS